MPTIPFTGRRAWFYFLKRLFSGRGREAARKFSARVRPRLEVLEDRALPSILVMSATDSALRSAVAQANTDAAGGTSDTIKFDSSLNGDTITLTSQLELSGAGTGTITIDGGGQITLSGGSSVRLFQVDSGVTAILENLTLENGSAGDNGGAASNAGTLTLTNDTLSGNSVGGSNGGGAVYSTGTLTVTNSTLSGNSTPYGSGGAILASGMVSVAGSTFSNNYAGSQNGGGGGAIYSNGTLQLSSSTLSGNSADLSSGGGVFSKGGTATISNDTLSGNYAFYNGCGIYNAAGSTMTVNNSTSISNNQATAEGAGGGICNAGNLTISDAAISGNEVDSYYGGGGIYNTGSLNISSATISGNSNGGYGNGGGIWNSGTLSFSGTVSGNKTTSGDGGGIYNNQGTITINNAVLSGNTANYGGGIFNDVGGVLTVSNTTFSANKAGQSGGGLDNNASLTLSTSTFAGNSAVFGGGLFNNNLSLTISNSTFAGNHALSYGGGIDNQGILTVANATIYGNTVSTTGTNQVVTDGGGIFSNNSLTLLNSIVAGNAATGSTSSSATNVTIVGPDIDGALTPDSSFNLIGNGSGMTGISNGDANSNQVGTSKSPINPLLGPLADNGGPTQTMALLPGSPAIGTGGPVNGLTADQRGDPLAAPLDIGAFQYFLPLITGVSPALGGIAGGALVTITGYNLGNVAVKFGDNAATQITSDTATQIVATSPGGAVGTVHITVTTANGSSVPGPLDQFSYESTPTISSVTPAAGPSAGGTSVQISGTSLAGATAVYFGAAVPANAATIVSDTTTELTVTSPAEGAGQVEVTIQTPFGTSTVSPPNDEFTFALPRQLTVISALDPATLTPGTLRYAVNQANADAPQGISDTITFDTAQMGTNTITLSHGPLELTAGSGVFTVDGGGQVVISGSSAQSLFQVDSGAQGILKRLTITAGATTMNGGAIVNAGTLTLVSDTVSDNIAAKDGGAVENSGTLAVNFSTLSGNAAKVGGAIHSTGTLTVTATTLSGNSAGYGGGIFNDNGTAALVNSTFASNIADTSGGGLDNAGTLTESGNLFQNNSATYGGGFYNNNDTMTAGHDTLRGNTGNYGGGLCNGGNLTVTDADIADSSGDGVYNSGTLTLVNSAVGNSSAGGITNSSGTLTISSSTIASNADDGIYNASGTVAVSSSTIAANGSAGIDNWGTLALQNSIIAANHSGGDDLYNEYSGTLDSASDYNLIGNGSGVNAGGMGQLGGTYNQVGTGSHPIDPQLAPLGNYGGPTPTMALLAGSPAIGAGELLAGITTDQRGLPLPAMPDIGAFQTQASTFLTLTATLPAGGAVVAGLSYSAQLGASGGAGSNTFSLAAGTLPAGMSLSSAGVFSGTPTVAGPYKLTVLATNNINTGVFGIQTYTFSVSPAAVASFTVTAPSLATTGFAFDVKLTAKDAFGNVVSGYTGTAAIASSDGQNVHATPAAIAFSKGIAQVAVTLNNAGAVTLTVTAGTIHGSASMDVRTPVTLTVTSALDPVTLAPGTLRAAFNQAAADALLNLSDSIAFDTAAMGTSAITLTQGVLELTGGPGAVNVNGGGTLTLSGGGVNGVFMIDSDASANISGLTITQGTGAAFSQGGGISNEGTLTVTDSTLTGNDVGNGEGGGIANLGGGTLTLNNVIFSTNSAGYEGGALYNDYGAVLNANHVTFTGNSSAGSSGSGGAVYNSGSVTMTNATLFANLASEGGGALANSGTMTLSDATFEGNTAFYAGGAIYNDGSLRLTNVTLFHGVSSGDGGGIYQDGGSLTLADSTVSGNSAAGNGGGILQNNGVVVLQGTIVAGNSATGSDPDVSGSVAANSSHNLIGNNTGLSGLSATAHNQVGTSAHPIDPLLAPLGSYGGPNLTMALLPHSPALAAGAVLNGVTTDERGITRPATPDIGAYQTRTATFLAMSPATLAPAPDGQTYAATIKATGGSGHAAFSVAAGALPPGLSLSTAGVLGGKPTLAGTFDFTVLATDAATAGLVGIQTYTLTVTPGTVAGFNVTVPAVATPGIGFSVTITAVDQDGNLVSSYAGGPVTLTSSDNQIVNVSPATINLIAGTATVTVTLNTADTVTLKASAGGVTQGTSNSINLSTQLVVTTASDQLQHSGVSLRDALTAANAAAAAGIADTITFDPAQMGTTTVTLEQGQLELTSGTAATTINGGGLIAISGAGGSGVLLIDQGASATLNGLTITQGGNVSGGAGLDNSGITVVTNCTFSNNTLTRFARGAGIYNRSTGTLTVSSSTFADNSAYGGAGIENDGTLTVSDSTFTGNSAAASFGGGPGGGLDNNGTATVANSTFWNNAADEGGGICNNGNASLTVSDCTLSGNNAYYFGGGLYAYNQNTITLFNTLVAGNTSAAQNGAAPAPDVGAQVTAASAYNLIGDGTGLTGISNGTNHNQIGTSTVPLDAKLGSSLANNGGPTQTLALQGGSPASGTGGPITTIAQNAGTSDQTIYVADAAAIASTPGQYFILVDGEEIEVTGVNRANNSLSVIRDINGVATSLTQNDPVVFFADQRGFVAAAPADIGAVQTQAVGAPAFTSAASTTFIMGAADNSFTVGASGFPAPSLTENQQDSLPTGVNFDAATGTLNGTPAADSQPSYTLHFTAHNNAGTATQTLTLYIVQAPQFTNADTSTTFTAGAPGSYSLTAVGVPAPTISEDDTDRLPAGITFNASTGQLSGIPLPGSGGTYVLHFHASNGFGQDVIQTFTLTVNSAPVFTSPASTIFAAGTFGSFPVTAAGSPAATIAESAGDTLPSGVMFSGGVLSGMPTSTGTYTLHFTAHNGQGKDATQTFTLIVGQAPAFTSATSTTFLVGKKGSFTVKASGTPAVKLSESLNDTLPSGVTFNPATGMLSGTPAAGAGGVYTLHFIAHNGAGADATQTFTLTVNQALAFTSATKTTFVENLAGSFPVSATGYPTPTLSGPMQILTKTGTLVASFDPATGVLSHSPALATSGIYKIVFTAHDGVMKDVTQTFTLTVTPLTLTLNAPAGVIEGLAQSKVLVGKFTDADNTNSTTYTIQVKWGDGQVSSLARGAVTVQADPSPGVFDIIATKPAAYAEASSALKFSISISAHGFIATQSATISIADATIALNTPLSAPAPVVGHALTSIQVATFTDLNLLSKPSDFTVTINWGDGTTSAGVIAADPLHKGRFIIHASKAKPYSKAQTGLTFTVTVKDKEGAMDSKQVTINVSAK